MIVVTRLNDSQFAINPDLIERINSNPDTTLVMVDGAKYIVTETMAEVIDRIACYRARVISLAHAGPANDHPHSGWQLGLVREVPDIPAASAVPAAPESPESAASAASLTTAAGGVAEAPAIPVAQPLADAVPLRPRRL